MMRVAPSAPTDETLGWVQDALAAAANSVALDLEPRPDLVSRVFRGGEDVAAATLSASELPSAVRAARIGRYTALLGLLPDEPTPEALAEALRRYRNQCVVVRSYLTPNEALDLQLFLIGPRGSERIDVWRPIALEVERDERVARKLAWLRPAEPEADAASFAEFLKRTFLARPWNCEGDFTMAALDTLNRLASLGNSSIPRDTVGEWIQLSLSKNDDADALVDGLVVAWASRGRT